MNQQLESKEPPSAEIKFVGYRILQQVWQDGLWKGKGKDGYFISKEDERIVNKDKIVAIATQELAKSPPQQTTIELPVNGHLENQVQQQLTQFIDYGVSKGWLPPEAVRLGNRMTKPSEIRVVDSLEGAGGINFDLRPDLSLFPDESNQALDIIITAEAIKNRATVYQQIATSCGIEMTDDQIISVSVVSIAAHEWAHSVERGLQTQFEKIAGGITNGTSNLTKAIWLRLDLLYRRSTEVSLPLLDNLSDHDRSSTFREQFASAFELEAVNFSLLQMGASEQQAKTFLDTIKEGRSDRLKQFSALRKALNIPDFDLHTLAWDVQNIMREANLEYTVIPYLFGDIGYMGWFAPDQLKFILESTLKYLDDADAIKKDLVS